MRIWALGDIHSNASALRAALRLIDERPADRVVFLGDLLSYGAEPQEVLELVGARVAQGAVVVLGNHDELYRGVGDGSLDGLERMSPWLAESVEWTAQQVDPRVLQDLPFQVEHVEERALFAHANPWFDRPSAGARWAYLTSSEDHRLAAEVLRSRRLSVGVFGHTHRSRIIEFPSELGLDDPDRMAATWVPQSDTDVLLLNAGSVGQPRNRQAVSTLLELEGDRDGWTVEVHPVEYDVEAHLATLQRLPVSDAAQARLARFFRPRGPRCAPSPSLTPPSFGLDATS